LIAKAQSKISVNELQCEIKKLIKSKKIQESDGFYFLKGRMAIVKTRK